MGTQTADTATTHRSGSLGDRAMATLVGVLYLIGTVAGISSVVVTSGGLDGPDHLTSAASIGPRLPAGALLVVLMGIALALIPVVAFPVLRRTSERLALGYLVFRGALETTGYLLTAAAWLMLFHLARDTATTDMSGSPALARMLADAGEVGGTLVTVAFLTGAAMFYAVLFRARLVPRWLSGWGLLAIAPYLLAAVLKMFGVIEAFSPSETVLVVPLAVQEMVLAVWLIARGFGRDHEVDR